MAERKLNPLLTGGQDVYLRGSRTVPQLDNVSPPMPRPTVTTAAYEPPPTELPSLDDMHLSTEPPQETSRQAVGHLAAGLLDATVGSIPVLASLPAAAYNTATRPLEGYPEGVDTSDTWTGLYSRVGHNIVNNAEDERRYTDIAREGLYDFDTQVGEVAMNYGPMASIPVHMMQAIMGERDPGYERFQRDINAEQGEPGYVSPAEEIIPEAIAAAIPSPFGKAGLVARGAALLDDVPRMLTIGAKIADGIIDNLILPFAAPGKISQATNAGVSAALTEGQRYIGGEDTLIDWPALGRYWEDAISTPADNMTPAERTVAGVQSSGINAYGSGDSIVPEGN